MTLVFFRSININQSEEVYSVLFSGDGNAVGVQLGSIWEQLASIFKNSSDTGLSHGAISSVLPGWKHYENLQVPFHVSLFLLLAIILDHFIVMQRIDNWFLQKATWIRWMLYVFFIVAVLFWGGAVNHPFVYFQF
jgi:hypothetical protein